MSSNLISHGEKVFIQHGIEHRFRNDGRILDEYRLILVDRNVAINCNGSSHVRCGNNDILVGIKLELENEVPDDSNELGKVEVFADVTANASPQFEGRYGEEIGNEITAIFTAILSQFLDLKALVFPNKSFWIVHVDVVILECGARSALLDTISVAIKTALFDTKVPKVTFRESDGEFEISDDPFDADRLNVEKLPLLITLTRISSHFIVDITVEEELSSITSILFAVNKNDGIVFVKKLGIGSLSPEGLKESDIFEKAKILGIQRDERLMKKLVNEETKQQSNINFTI